jgi:BirA family biotin operon repressor/biotin-[acetyl-CoA-carboxylase] ligase
MKSSILKMLEGSQAVISGEKLSERLGISRVSVWKHIKKLNELGYAIESTPKGYRLIHSPDIPFAWEFPGREETFHYYPEVGSTMDVARDMARRGSPHFSVVVADCQSKGRGRLKRHWLSEPGGLFFTIILRPELTPVYSYRANFAASYTLARILQTLYEIDARVKWPNDILVGEKKLVGMLTEMEAESDLVTYINIGIGINVNNDPTRQEPQSTSLCQLLDRPTSRKSLLARFLDAYEAQVDLLTDDTVIEKWKRHSMTLNRQVRIVTTQGTHEGMAVDVNDNGALILRQKDGRLKTIVYGDCFVQPQNP